MSQMLVILALVLPLFASTTSLLSHAINDPMKVLIAIVFFHIPFVFFVTFPRIFSLTLLAPNPQAIRAGTIPAKLTFVFLLFAPAALPHFSIHHFNYL